MNQSEISFSHGKIEPAPLLDLVRRLDPMHNELFDIADEIAFGRLFADVFRSIALYNTTAKSWMIYNGTIWEQDEGNVRVEKLAQTLSRCLRIYVAETMSDTPTDFEKSYQHSVNRLGDRSKRLKMIQDAQAHCYINSTSLDANTALFNCLNGTLDLDTLEFREHRATDLLTKVSGADYDPEARSTDWEAFMCQIMEDNTDKIEYLQRLCGYSLTADNSQEEAYLLYGSTTRNGKSTFLETIGHVMGGYGLNMDPETLAQRDRNSRNASGDIARLNGVRFLRCSEPPKRMVLDCARLKTLLGRDTITARQLYEREQEFTPVFKLFFNSNYLPIISDDTVFSSGRLKVISFDRHFTEEEQDKGLKARLISPENCSGILNWMLDGLRAYRLKGAEPPDAVKNATAQYRQQSDKLQNFIDEKLEPCEGNALAAGEVYEKYSEWCTDNGYHIDNKRNFFDDLRSKNLLSNSGTVNGRTVRNVIKNYAYTGEYQNNPFVHPPDTH